MFHHKTSILSVIGLQSNNMDKKVFNTKYELFKRKAYIIIYGTNTPLGKLFDLVLLALIVISVIMVMLETVQAVRAVVGSGLSGGDV